MVIHRAFCFKQHLTEVKYVTICDELKYNFVMMLNVTELYRKYQFPLSLYKNVIVLYLHQDTRVFLLACNKVS